MGEVCLDCTYESESMQGVKIHYGKSHEGTLSGVLVECGYCGTEMRKDEYRLERSENLFCSTDCHDKWREENVRGKDAGGWQGKTVEVQCDYCDEVFETFECRVETHNNKFCDESCYADWQEETGIRRGKNNGMYGVVGSNHPAWKGGTDQSWRRQAKWRRTASAVYRRDDYTCQDCGNSDTVLHAHHIVPVHDNGPKFDIDNLVAVCPECHWTRHRNL